MSRYLLSYSTLRRSSSNSLELALGQVDWSAQSMLERTESERIRPGKRGTEVIPFRGPRERPLPLLSDCPGRLRTPGTETMAGMSQLPSRIGQPSRPDCGDHPIAVSTAHDEDDQPVLIDPPVEHQILEAIVIEIA